jgi:hypothetical protein
MICNPDNVEILEPEEGKSLASLQLAKRLIIHGELVDKSA